MATQRTAISRTQRLARRWFRHLTTARAMTTFGKLAPLIALILVLLLTPLGQSAPRAHAAGAGAPSCPTWYTDGAAQCQGTVTQVGPPTIQPPPSTFVLGTWTVCVPFSQVLAWNPYRPQLWYTWWDSYNDWSGNWLVDMIAYPFGVFPTGTMSPFYYQDTSFYQLWQHPPTIAGWITPPAGGWGPCPPPVPPCQTCIPIPTIQSVYYNFWAYAPVAIVSGRSSCTDGSFQQCPPSVGHPIQMWVDRFVSSVGPTSACTDLTNVGNYAGLYQSLIFCMQWRQQAAPPTWSFDDEEVDPNTGQGQQVPGVNIGVPGGSGPNNPVSHVFQYSSAFNPLRGCVRPCTRSELTGPKGSPAFQVSVSSNWWLYFGISIDGLPFTWTQVDLTQYGAAQPYFTSVTTVPVPVFSYGSVTTP